LDPPEIKRLKTATAPGAGNLAADMPTTAGGPAKSLAPQAGCSAFVFSSTVLFPAGLHPPVFCSQQQSKAIQSSLDKMLH